MSAERERFDDLAVGLARGKLSRGQALELLGGVLAGGLLAFLGGGGGEAALADNLC